MEAEAIEEPLTPQERWRSICKVAKEKAEEVMGIRKRGKRTNDQQIQQMAKEKHKLQKDIEASTDQNQRKDKLRQKKELKLKIRKRIKEVNTIQIENRLKGIERMKNDSTRYFAVLKELKSKKEKRGIIVKDKNGKTIVTEQEQTEVVTAYFKQMLAP